MNKKAIILLLAFCLMSHAATAWTVRGAGGASCGRVSGDAEEHEAFFTSWILGFFSGLNLLTESNTSSDVDVRAIWAAVEKYCAENPLEDMKDGALDVYLRLKDMNK